jgi:hypothetical protein
MYKLNFKDETRFLCVFWTINNIFITNFGPFFFTFLTINSNSYVSLEHAYKEKQIQI